MPNEFSINQESNNQILFLHVSAPETPLLNGSDPPGPEFEVLASHSAPIPRSSLHLNWKNPKAWYRSLYLCLFVPLCF